MLTLTKLELLFIKIHLQPLPQLHSFSYTLDGDLWLMTCGMGHQVSAHRFSEFGYKFTRVTVHQALQSHFLSSGGRRAACWRRCRVSHCRASTKSMHTHTQTQASSRPEGGKDVRPHSLLCIIEQYKSPI